MSFRFFSSGAISYTTAGTIWFQCNVVGDINTRFSITATGGMQWGDGTAGADCNFGRIAAGVLGTTTGTLQGKSLRVPVGGGGQLEMAASGVGPVCGTAVLVGGTVAVAAPTIDGTFLVFLSRAVDGGTLGNLSYVVTNGVGFTINSTNVLDTSTVVWMMVKGL